MSRKPRWSRRDRELLEHYDPKYQIAPVNQKLKLGKPIADGEPRKTEFASRGCGCIYDATNLNKGYCWSCQNSGKMEVKISEIAAGMKVTLRAKLAVIEESRVVLARYGPRRLAEAKLYDDSGVIELDLWGKQQEGLNFGDQVKLANAYARWFKGRLHLSIGAEGSIEKVSMLTDDYSSPE